MAFDFRTAQILDNWDRQFAGVSCHGAARLIHSLSFQLTSDGVVALKGKPKEKAARAYLVDKITEWVPKFLETAEDQQGGESAALFLGAYSLLQTLPPHHILPQLIQRIDTCMENLETPSFTRVPAYLATLGVYPGHEFIDHWGQVAGPVSMSWDTVEAYRAVYQLAILDFLGQQQGNGQTPCRGIVAPIMAEIVRQADVLFPDEVDSRVYYAALWFGDDFIQTRHIQSRDETISGHEITLAEGLKAKGFQVDEDYVLPQTERRLDLVVRFNRHSVGIEIDGPSHFIYDADNHRMQYDGSTRFHTALSAQLMGPDFRLLRIPFVQFEKKTPIDNIQKTLRSLNGQAKGAAYIMRGVESLRETNAPDAWQVPYSGPY